MSAKKAVGLFQRMVTDQQVSSVRFKERSSTRHGDPLDEQSPQQTAQRAAKDDYPRWVRLFWNDG